MKYVLPNFDELQAIAANNPEQLEKIRQEAIESLIANAPVEHRRRLRGIQFQVEMELRRSVSPLDGCVRISKLMNETLWQFNSILNEALESLEGTAPPRGSEFDLSEGAPKTAKILEFETTEA